MTEPQGPQHAPPPPEPVVRRERRWLPSLVWVVPLVAALIGLSLVVHAVLQRGPTIAISFRTAEGLEPGKTQVKYKDVEIGMVKTIKLSDDLSHVLVMVQLKKEAKRFAVEGSRFWVVRPRVAANGVSGLSTLLSGAYIGADAGRKDDTQDQFVGLESPPAVTGDQKGTSFVLHGDSLGSIDIGSPIYYRRVPVGQVVAFSLDPDGTGVTVNVFVNAPYDQYVGTDTRWWQASGVDLRLDSSGFKLNTQSLAAVVLGGIAFQSPPNETISKPAPDGTAFSLTADEASAMRDPDGPPMHVVMNFNQSLRGLSVGAPVDFRGIELGEVTHIDVDYDAKTDTFSTPVRIDLYPERLGKQFRDAPADKSDRLRRQHLLEQVQRGLRGQLRTGNLLTNQLYVALDFFPKAAPAQVNPNHDPVEIPTVPNTLDELQLQVADIAKKLDKVPFDQIGNNLNDSLKHADALFVQLGTQVAPEARDTLASAKQTFDTAQATLQQDSPLQNDMHTTLQQLTRTLQSLNALSDYLERHPESLLRGKPGDKQ
jgi:paraquat-inducible protein B